LGSTINQRIIAYAYVLHLLGLGHRGPLLVFHGVCSVCTGNAAGPGDCGLGVLIAEKADVRGETRVQETPQIDAPWDAFFGKLPCLGLLSSVAKFSKFLEYEHPV
jgi:hypothetical protein